MSARYYYFVGGPLTGYELPTRLISQHAINIQDVANNPIIQTNPILFQLWNKWNSNPNHNKNQAYYYTTPIVVGNRNFTFYQHSSVLNYRTENVMSDIIFTGLTALKQLPKTKITI